MAAIFMGHSRPLQPLTTTTQVPYVRKKEEGKIFPKEFSLPLHLTLAPPPRMTGKPPPSPAVAAMDVGFDMNEEEEKFPPLFTGQEDLAI